MRSIRRSTLSEAPAKRDPRPFADMLIELSALCGRTLRKQAGDLLYLLDSTPIVLKGRGFDQWTTHNGRITGLKLHILMNHADQCPVAHSITDARVNDVDERHIMQPEKGATYVFDKGYCDYNWWAKLDEAGAYFVTRLKTNAAVETIQRFLGRSANAVKLQILCAMIAYLLLKLYRQSGRMGESLHLLCARIAGSLFERPQTPYAHYARRRRERLEPARMQGVLF
jgi:transposase DDE domain